MVGGLVCAARAGVAGDEDSIAAFFLTIADEQTQSEFCKSDPAVAAVACDTCTTARRSHSLTRAWQAYGGSGSSLVATTFRWPREKRLRCVSARDAARHALQPRGAPHAEPVVSDDEENAVRLSAGGVEGNPEYREEPSPQWRPLRG